MYKMAPPNKKQKVLRSWQEIAKQAQDHRDASLAQVKPGLPDSFATLEGTLEDVQSHLQKGVAIMAAVKILHPDDVKITEMLPERLIAALASGDLSTTEVTTAFLRRAAISQKLVSVEISLSQDLKANSGTDELHH
jgi:amidase